MTFSLRPIARRLLALLAIVGVMGGAVAPACEGMAVKSAATQHCGDADGHCAPTPGAHHSSSGHRELPGQQAPCTMGACVPVMMPSAPPSGRAAPILVPAVSVETVLSSAAPQHTTPPPRS